MAQLNENRGTANFLVSEANGMYRSRDVGTVAAGAAPGLQPGTILGKLDSGGNYVAYDPAVTTGAEDIAGILFEAAVGTVKRTIITRDCEVNGAHLVYQAGANDAAKATANAALKALGIIVR
ncbi:Bacteriophage lambda head decoration protein D OS=Bosea thiooxidans OX=53254 GN=SAMN05660750_03335 PE=4 SV=1 [Bosea thiooxidans]|uniref:Bacteriophage lambda head decoration protein D n=1 Tax=Bosea thiooxidans TaxID=53254 RepID=A0A1T5FLG9_9HYPH|nr:head decoration protein [Bosea thiooxidans]SKB97019.1 Bacteriophage lambda head decoration protein D [Bosea thiooxidans]